MATLPEDIVETRMVQSDVQKMSLFERHYEKVKLDVPDSIIINEGEVQL